MDHDAAEPLLLEQAAAFFDDLRSAAGNAPSGKVIDKAEHFAVVQGREWLRSSLEAIVQERIHEVEQEEKKRYEVLLRRNISRNVFKIGWGALDQANSIYTTFFIVINR